MVRRAEYALGKAIRRGQEEGTVYKPGQHVFVGNQHGSGAGVDSTSSSMRPVTDFASHNELVGNNAGIYDLADGVEKDDFEAALSEAKDEGNLSRANVVRKVKGQKVTCETNRSRGHRTALFVDQLTLSCERVSAAGSAWSRLRMR